MGKSVANLVFSLAIILPTAGRGQQRPDTSYHPPVGSPAYARGQGPRLLFDQAHHNLHRLDGGYRAFAELAEQDGYRVLANTRHLGPEPLAETDVLVIVNARGGEGIAAAGMPALNAAEIASVRSWVSAGGALLLVADHAPFGAAAESLAAAFGVGMSKGFTLDTAVANRDGPNASMLRFSRANNLLGDHPILRGRDADEMIDVVVTFTGQSLTLPRGAAALLRLSPTALDRPPPSAAETAALAARIDALRDSIRRARALPGGRVDSVVVRTPARLSDSTTTSAAGRAQGLALTFGRGRVVVLGEAACLSAQVVSLPGADPVPIGMNAPGNDNRQFALNILHWLSGALEPDRK